MTTIVILTLTLVSVQVLLAVNVAGRIALEELESRVDLRVQFRPSTSEDAVDALRTQIAAREEVADVVHIPRAEVLKQFEEAHAGNPEILEALAELNENPFGPELRVHVRDPKDFKRVEEMLVAPDIAERVIATGSGDRSALVERLAALTAKLRLAGLALSGISFLVTLLIIINAMRIVAYVRRDEVGIMKLVGAANWFIRTPFLVMGVIAAAIATAITWALTFPLLRLAEPTLHQLLGIRALDIATFFRHNGWEVAGLEFVGLSLLTVIVSAIAIRRYLRV